MAGTGRNTSQDAKRHGHTGNRKNHQVIYRPSAEERLEMAEFGCTDVDTYTVSPSLTCNKAFELAERLEKMQYEVSIQSNCGE